MVANNVLIRIFWPSDALIQQLSGVLVGFRNSDNDVFVVSVLLGVELRHVQNALSVGTLVRNSPHNVQELIQRCGDSPLRVVGTVNQTIFDDSDTTILRLQTDSSSAFPKLRLSFGIDATAQVVVYDRPNPIRMQYLSIHPISLALGDKTTVPQWDKTFARIEESQLREKERKARLVEKLRLHQVILRSPTRQELMLPMLINQVNCSYELNALLQKNIGMIGRRMKRAMSVSESLAESANDLWDYLYMAVAYIVKVWLWPFIGQLCIFVLITHRVMAEGVLQILHCQLGKVASFALRDVSATAQQIDIRLQQSCYWPVQYLKLRKRKSSWDSITTTHPEYIRFYNSLWLVANDIIMGIALGSYIVDNATAVAASFDMVFNTWSVEGLRSMITWLMGWPGGLKLNTELADFLGDLFLWVIDYWAGCVLVLRPHLPMLIKIIGFSAFGGATMPISIFSDLVSLLTIHIHSSYMASGRIFNWQLSIIVSLFHLFRGKKRNVLRNRIDSCDYDLDQLLLGTVLFTLQFFLLPTVFVYYLTFATARVLVIALKAVLEMGLACLNHFPLFAVMLRLKDPRRLPGGICFELQDVSPVQLKTKTTREVAPTAYVMLKSLPLPFGAMFQPYFELGRRIRTHYFSVSVLLCLVSGRYVPPIHRRNLYSFQYSMLPAQRSSISELWQNLTEKNDIARSSHAPTPLASSVPAEALQNHRIRKNR
ncbi:pig-Q [Coniothyrium glycines]